MPLGLLAAHPNRGQQGLGFLAQALGLVQLGADLLGAGVQAASAERQAVEEANLAKSLAAAEAAIRSARDQAMANVRVIASETAQAILVKLTGSQASAAEIETALSGEA